LATDTSFSCDIIYATLIAPIGHKSQLLSDLIARVVLELKNINFLRMSTLLSDIIHLIQDEFDEDITNIRKSAKDTHINIPTFNTQENINNNNNNNNNNYRNTNNNHYRSNSSSSSSGSISNSSIILHSLVPLMYSVLE
jgi:hypothetical protein